MTIILNGLKDVNKFNFHFLVSLCVKILNYKIRCPVLQFYYVVRHSVGGLYNSLIFGWDPADRAQPLCNRLRNG